MKLKLSDDYIIEYDDLGYTLEKLTVRDEQKKGADGKLQKTGNVLESWAVEGYYGTIEQAIRGAYRHEVHAAAIERIEQLKEMEDAFVTRIMLRIREQLEEEE